MICITHKTCPVCDGAFGEISHEVLVHRHEVVLRICVPCADQWEERPGNPIYQKVEEVALQVRILADSETQGLPT